MEHDFRVPQRFASSYLRSNHESARLNSALSENLLIPCYAIFEHPKNARILRKIYFYEIGEQID